MKVLLVDDDARFRERVKELLLNEHGFEIIAEAEDGQTAISKVRELQPDLILMDIRMPGMNGIDVTQHLKHEHAHIKIIILTAFDIDAYKEAAIGSGANAYLVKKRVMDTLVTTIRQLEV